MSGAAGGNVIGTKLRCATCGAEVLVIRPGDGKLFCHGQPMEVVAGGSGTGSAGE